MIPLKAATRWLSIADALIGALFILPVLMLFYGYKGVPMGDFFLIQGVCSLGIFLFEIPTGYIGDIFSRKNTLIIGTLVWITGYLIWIFNRGFWPILIGEVLFSLAVSLISGTLEAYLYDLLKKRHKEDIFHKKYAKMQMLGNLSLTISTLTGGFIYQFIGETAPLWISIFCLTGAFIILLLLPDVPESRRTVAKDKNKWQDILDISKYAMKNHEIKWLMLFPAVYGTLTFVLMWGLQSVMVFRGLPVFMFSIVMGANAFLRTFWSGVSGKILEKIQLSGIIMLECVIIVIAAIGACAAAYVPVEMVYLCLLLMMMASSSVVLSKMATTVLINHRIQSDERATILSVSSMVNRIFWAVGMFALKPLFDSIGVGPTFGVSALLLIPILICARHLYKMKLKMKKDTAC
ncbi:MAG: MFS transporter [Alphaproteobacteria bacterium]|nr:MFS transporter [Alphaproteobacteria bacterium]